jgi:hypothetical protein
VDGPQRRVPDLDLLSAAENGRVRGVKYALFGLQHRWLPQQAAAGRKCPPKDYHTGQGYCLSASTEEYVFNDQSSGIASHLARIHTRTLRLVNASCRRRSCLAEFGRTHQECIESFRLIFQGQYRCIDVASCSRAQESFVNVVTLWESGVEMRDERGGDFWINHGFFKELTIGCGL